ncbi:hypothetical protein [Methylococcus sp. EFPC2]|uniref:hypothetical protein n=1 Tax=Methylococcus sp. EFPC2 TaxID=2812648 RepID=UPI0019679C68|nr:hypothetical protein [Methylococcus sp. EFPC2]QSA97125.1 hypothetical protein JWZ97_18355 [Methylococcus sp. EFPC2]
MQSNTPSEGVSRPNSELSDNLKAIVRQVSHLQSLTSTLGAASLAIGPLPDGRVLCDEGSIETIFLFLGDQLARVLDDLNALQGQIDPALSGTDAGNQGGR